MKKRCFMLIISLCLLCIMLSGLSLNGFAATTVMPEAAFDYDVVDNGAIINNIDIDTYGKDIVIPEKLGGYFVTSVTFIGNDIRKANSLDASRCSQLEILNCPSNSFKSLRLPNTSTLEMLFCGSNELTSLDVSPYINLKVLEISGNKLISIDLSKCKKLERLNCTSNNLASLDISRNTELKQVYCINNKIPVLNISNNTKLEELLCQHNQLMELDISNNNNLKVLVYTGNFIADETNIREWNMSRGIDYSSFSQQAACYVKLSGRVGNSFNVGDIITLQKGKHEKFITNDSTITLSVSNKSKAKATITGDKLIASTPGDLYITATIKRTGAYPYTYVYEYYCNVYLNKTASNDSSTSDSMVQEPSTSNSLVTDSSSINSSLIDTSIPDSTISDSAEDPAMVSDEDNSSVSSVPRNKKSSSIAWIIILSIIVLVALSIIIVFKKKHVNKD